MKNITTQYILLVYLQDHVNLGRIGPAGGYTPVTFRYSGQSLLKRGHMRYIVILSFSLLLTSCMVLHKVPGRTNTEPLTERTISSLNGNYGLFRF